MLAELRIRQLAIIDDVTVPFTAGLNVLSGETGAGKSIIVEALGLLLGDRAASDLVRTGEGKAVVEGVFEIGDAPLVRGWLDAQGIECDDGTVILKREVAASGGRARAWVNGAPVSAAQLATIGRHLVDIHGQHEAQALLDEPSQRRILDAFADALAEAEAVREAHRALAEARRAIDTLETRREEAQKRADWLRHVVEEIEGAKLVAGEEERLHDDARRLAHAEELRAIGDDVVGVLESEEEGVLARLGALQRSLAQLARIDGAAAERMQCGLDGAFYALEELARDAAAYRESIDADPEALAEIDRRRDLVFRLAKKHGGTAAAAIEAGRAAREELDLLDRAAFDLRSLERTRDAAAATFAAAAATLTAKRRAAATRLAADVEQWLPGLGMPDGRFEVQLVATPSPSEVGAETVEFRVALNLGHDSRPLARVASGGELARVMLALKTILARVDHVPTLVFDEVDAGIGGVVGTMVGDAMRRVAAHHQVFAITHLPQIASRAHRHVVVTKAPRGGVTSADVAVVEGETRVAEIARMLGGDPESATSRQHASELLASGVRAVEPPAASPRRARRPTA
ncbi:MAG: DNA repair protein RecN [Gemmatimonadaceae bacterium]|nr:DNA repair protein RecN [Gemmatimonadaceae bacterium]